MWCLALWVRSTRCKDTSHCCRQGTGRNPAARARGRGGREGLCRSCAEWKGAAGAAGKGAELREASGKSPVKGRSMLERRRRYVHMFGSDNHHMKGLDT